MHSTSLEPTPNRWLSSARILTRIIVAAALAGCSLLVGNEDRTVDDGDAASSAGGSSGGSDAARDATQDASTEHADATAPRQDGSSPLDAASPALDAGLPPVDAAPPVDAGATPPACPPPGAPPGTRCCGAVACIGEACQYCTDCRAAGCAANEYCCVVVNGGGHVKGVTCSATATCH